MYEYSRARRGGRVQGQAGYMNASRLFGVAEIDLVRLEVGGWRGVGQKGALSPFWPLGTNNAAQRNAARRLGQGIFVFPLVASLCLFALFSLSWGWRR